MTIVPDMFRTLSLGSLSRQNPHFGFSDCDGPVIFVAEEHVSFSRQHSPRTTSKHRGVEMSASNDPPLKDMPGLNTAVKASGASDQPQNAQWESTDTKVRGTPANVELTTG